MIDCALSPISGESGFPIRPAVRRFSTFGVDSVPFSENVANDPSFHTHIAWGSNHHFEDRSVIAHSLCIS